MLGLRVEVRVWNRSLGGRRDLMDLVYDEFERAEFRMIPRLQTSRDSDQD